MQKQWFMRSVLWVVLVLPKETAHCCVLHFIEFYSLAIGWRALLCLRKHFFLVFLKEHFNSAL